MRAIQKAGCICAGCTVSGGLAPGSFPCFDSGLATNSIIIRFFEVVFEWVGTYPLLIFSSVTSWCSIRYLPQPESQLKSSGRVVTVINEIVLQCSTMMMMKHLLSKYTTSVRGQHVDPHIG